MQFRKARKGDPGHPTFDMHTVLNKKPELIWISIVKSGNELVVESSTHYNYLWYDAYQYRGTDPTWDPTCGIVATTLRRVVRRIFVIIIP